MHKLWNCKPHKIVFKSPWAEPMLNDITINDDKQQTYVVSYILSSSVGVPGVE